MSIFANPFKSALLIVVALVLVLGSSPSDFAADMPRAQIEQGTPALSNAEYLDRYADLLMLRLRFGAVLSDELPGLMRAAARRVETNGVSEKDVQALRQDLEVELAYFVVNLKYLIMAEGAIWPEDKPARTYRFDALSELDEIARELVDNAILDLDIGHILHRLEAVNAWTEGQPKPVDDWFDPADRQYLIDDAVVAANTATSS